MFGFKGQLGLLLGDPERKKESEIAQLCPTLCNPMDCRIQTPSFMGFSRQEYWSGLPFPSPRDLPHPGLQPRSPALQADALPSEPSGKLWMLFLSNSKHGLLKNNITEQLRGVP